MERTFWKTAAAAIALSFGAPALAECDLCDFAKDGDLAGIESAFDSGQSIAVNGQTNSKGNTALILAAKHSNAQIVELLLAEGADPTIANNNGRTPLMWAVQNGDSGIVDLLLANNADPAHVNAIGAKQDISALQLALKKDYRDIAETLVSHGAVLQCDVDEKFDAETIACENPADSCTGFYSEEHGCLPNCPDGFDRLDDGSCICDADKNKEVGANACECKAGYEEDDNSDSCVPICEATAELVNGECECIYGYEMDENGNCRQIPDCGVNKMRDGFDCVCIDGTSEVGSSCLFASTISCSVSGGQWIADVVDNVDNGQCECPSDNELHNERCVPVCDGNEIRGDDGMCMCDADNGYERVDGNCVPTIAYCNSLDQIRNADLECESCEFYQERVENECLIRCDDQTQTRNPDDNSCICIDGLVEDEHGNCVLPSCGENQVRGDDGVSCVCDAENGFVDDGTGGCVPIEPPVTIADCHADGMMFNQVIGDCEGCQDNESLDQDSNSCPPLSCGENGEARNHECVCDIGYKPRNDSSTEGDFCVPTEATCRDLGHRHDLTHCPPPGEGEELHPTDNRFVPTIAYCNSMDEIRNADFECEPCGENEARDGNMCMCDADNGYERVEGVCKNLQTQCEAKSGHGFFEGSNECLRLSDAYGPHVSRIGKEAHIGSAFYARSAPDFYKSILQYRGFTEWYVEEGGNISLPSLVTRASLGWAKSGANGRNVVMYLIDNGAPVVNFIDYSSGFSILHTMAYRLGPANPYALNVMEYFLDNYPAVFDVNYQVPANEVAHIRRATALFFAVYRNHQDAVEFLVDNGADCNLAGPYGHTPLTLAEEEGYADISAYLEDNCDS